MYNYYHVEVRRYIQQYISDRVHAPLVCVENCNVHSSYVRTSRDIEPSSTIAGDVVSNAVACSRHLQQQYLLFISSRAFLDTKIEGTHMHGRRKVAQAEDSFCVPWLYQSGRREATTLLWSGEENRALEFYAS